MDLFSQQQPSDVRNEMSKLIGQWWVDELDINMLYELHTILENIKKYEKENKVTCYPKHDDCLRSLRMIKPATVRAVIISKCPYPNENADGIPFSCAKYYSESIKNVHFSCSKDINIFIDETAINNYPMRLDSWVNEGVLLLNRKHRVLENDPNSFDNANWDGFMEYLVKYLFRNDKTIVFCGWGSEAKKILTNVDKTLNDKDFTYYLEEHPISAARKKRYWACSHFDDINKHLLSHSIKPVNWY